MVESAFGKSEIEARNQAFARVFQSTAMRLGQPISSDEINRAVQSGKSFDVISRQYNVPINKVCEYAENKSGNFRVYILCQVAKAGNIPVQFDGFNDCYEGTDKYYAAEALSADGFDILKNGHKLDDRDLRSLFANSQAYSFYDRGMRIKNSDFCESYTAPVGSLVLGGILAGFGNLLTHVLDEDDKDMAVAQKATNWGVGLMALGGALFVVRSGVRTYGKAQIRKAVNLYNNGALYTSNALELEYGFTGNGLYLSLSF